MPGRAGVVGWVLTPLLVACIAACGTPAPTQAYSIGVANGTTLTVTLFVNGRAVQTFGPGSGTGLDGIPASVIGPLPWSVEARSPSGRVLTSMSVHEGDVSSSSWPGGGYNKGVGGRVDLSCGRLDIWSGPPLIGGPFPLSRSP
jgi:hypothetical protein